MEKLEVKTGIKIEIHNKDYGRGCYFSEDDWNIEAIAPSINEAIKLIIPEYVKSGIYPDWVEVSDVKYVVHNDKQYVIDVLGERLAGTGPGTYPGDIRAEIEQQPLFEKLSKEKRERKEDRKTKELEIEKKEKERRERELLGELKKKYEG